MVLNVSFVHGLVIGVLGILNLFVMGFGYGGYLQYWRHIQRVDRNECVTADLHKRNIQVADPMVPLTSANKSHSSSLEDGIVKGAVGDSSLSQVTLTSHEPV